MICETCGSELPSGSEFCPVCGAWAIRVPQNVLNSEEYLALESEALKSPIQRDLEDFAKAYMRELEGANPQELGEVEVVRPEVVARWRLIGVPEENIERMIRQREWVTEQREREEWIALPNISYPTPKTLVETEIKSFSLGIDLDGWVYPRSPYYHDKIRRIDRWLYKREGYRPLIGFSTSKIEPTEFMANPMLMGISARLYRKPRRPPTIMYYTRSMGARAVTCAYHAEPRLLIPEKARRAREILTLYRESPLIPRA